MKIEEFLLSSNPFFISSGMYIVGQLIQFYQNASKSEMIKLEPLIAKTKSYCKHPHEMVRKRALKTTDTINLIIKLLRSYITKPLRSYTIKPLRGYILPTARLFKVIKPLLNFLKTFFIYFFIRNN